MYSLEKTYSLDRMKTLAIRQMMAATNLYELCEGLEVEIIDKNRDYILQYLRNRQEYRSGLLQHVYGFRMTEEESHLWEDILNA